MKLRIFSALLTLVAVSACGMFGDEKPTPGCPRVFLLGEASNLVQYRDGPGRDITDVVLEGQIVNFAGECTFDGNVAELVMTVDISLRRGPANAQGRAQFSYFVAIPKFYPAPEGKQILPVDFAFGERQSRGTYHDELRLRVPIKEGERGSSYEVYIGFQLTPEQIEDNQKRRRR